MAFSYIERLAVDASDFTYAFTFPVLDASRDLTVTLSDLVINEGTLDTEWALFGSSIVLGSATGVMGGDKVRITRNTPTAALVDFQAGQIVTQAALDKADNQALFRALEAFDRAVDTLPIGGDAGAFLQKTSADDFDAQWVTVLNPVVPAGADGGIITFDENELPVVVLPSGPNTGEVLRAPLGSDGPASWELGGCVVFGPLDPTSDDGITGDFYINSVTKDVFGPKGTTNWAATIGTLTGTGGGGGGAVDSVFGRTGIVVALPSDYMAGQITNDSGVDGDFVDDALDDLDNTISGLITGVSMVFGRSGGVSAAASDYNASQVDNDSLNVAGAFVDDALDALDADIVTLEGRVILDHELGEDLDLKTFDIIDDNKGVVIHVDHLNDDPSDFVGLRLIIGDRIDDGYLQVLPYTNSADADLLIDGKGSGVLRSTAGDRYLTEADGTGGTVATTAEVDTGTDNAKFVSPLALDGSSPALADITADSITVDSIDLYYKTAHTGQTGMVNGSGILSVGAINTNFDLTAGSGYVVDIFTDPDNPVITEVTWTGFVAVPSTFAATDNISFILLTNAGAILQQNTEPTREQYRTHIVVGVLVHTGSVITETADSSSAIDSYLAPDLAHALGNINISGNNFNAAATDLTIRREAGVSFMPNSNRTVNAKDPNFGSSSTDTGVTFLYIYGDGAGGVTVVPSQTDIDPDQMDDGAGGLTTVSNNKWTNQLCYYSPVSNIVFVRYGEVQFDSLADALASNDVVPVPIGIGVDADLVRTILSLKEGVTDLTSVEAAITNTGRFGLGVGGGSLAGGGDASAIHVNTAGEIIGITAKVTPIAADVLVIEDTAAANVKKSVTLGSIDHGVLASTGTNSHAAIDSALTISAAHEADATKHFLESAIDHVNISNVGTNTHAQIDTKLGTSASHEADATLHFTKASIDHDAIGGLGDDDHSQYLLLAGRGSVQAVVGGTTAGGDLTLESTSNAAKGTIQMKDQVEMRSGSDIKFQDDSNVGSVMVTVPASLAASAVFTLPDTLGTNDEFALLAEAQSFSNKTLVTPTIASMTNAQHDHADAAGGGMLDHASMANVHIGTSAPGSPSAGDIFIHTTQALWYIYDSVRAAWLGVQETYTFGWRGSVGSDSSGRTAGNVSAQSANLEGHLIPHDMILVGYAENADSHPATAGADIQVRRGGSVAYSIVVDSGVNTVSSSSDSLDIDFAAGGTLACATADFIGNTITDCVVDLFFRRKFV